MRTQHSWRQRVLSVAWQAMLVVAALLFLGAISSTLDHGDGWGVQTTEGVVLGLLALGIALDFKRRIRQPSS